MVGRKLTVRYLMKTDVDQLEELDRKCFPPPVRYNRHALSYYLSLPTAFGIGEFQNFKLAGFIIVIFMTEDIANIVTIDVEPLMRKSGIGSKLINLAKKVLISQEVKKITLQVADDNIPAVNFYKKHGFKVVKRLPMYYPTTDGYQMELKIG